MALLQFFPKVFPDTKNFTFQIRSNEVCGITIVKSLLGMEDVNDHAKGSQKKQVNTVIQSQ